MRFFVSFLVLAALSACNSDSEPGNPAPAGSSGAGTSVAAGAGTSGSDGAGGASSGAGGAGTAGSAGNGGANLDGSISDRDDSSTGGSAGSGGAAGSASSDASRPDGDASAGDATVDGAEAGAGVSYFGCTFIGGIDRLVVTKSDPTRNLCLTLVLSSPGQMRAGLTLPRGFGVESASASPAGSCRSRNPSSATPATQVTGTVDVPDAGIASPREVNVDVTFSFAANDAGIQATERLNVQHLDVQGGCL